MKWPRSDRLTYKARNPRKAICQSSEYVFPSDGLMSAVKARDVTTPAMYAPSAVDLAMKFALSV